MNPSAQPRSAQDDELVLEGILVTIDASGQANVAPMGPRVDRTLNRFVLRPFQTSQSFRNLQATRVGVFHVTDDCLILAQAALGQLPQTGLVGIEGFSCPRLADACRWFALGVESLDDTQARAEIICRVVQQGELRPFFGFNRAKHAVLEAAILATRIGLLPEVEIEDQLRRLEAPVGKTAGSQEREAFALLKAYIGERLSATRAGLEG